MNFSDNLMGIKDHINYPQVVDEDEKLILIKELVENKSGITIKPCDVKYAKDPSGNVYIGKFYSKAKKPEDVVAVLARIHSKEVYEQFVKDGGEAEVYREC